MMHLASDIERGHAGKRAIIHPAPLDQRSTHAPRRKSILA